MTYTTEELQKLINIQKGGIGPGKIECRYKGENSWQWSHSKDATWDFENFEYRIKPEPREFIINVLNKNARHAEQAGIAYPVGSLIVGDNWIKVREVL